MITAIASVGGAIVKGVAGYFQNRQQIKAAKQTAELQLLAAKTEAKIKMMAEKQQSDIAWEQLQIERSGWKDELWTVIIAIPLVLCFIPGYGQYVKAGFDVLRESTPEWYQGLVFIAVGAAFGVRKLTDLMKTKKGA